MANAPHQQQDGRSYATDLRENESGIFLREGLDRLLVDLPSRHVQHVAAVAAAGANALLARSACRPHRRDL